MTNAKNKIALNFSVQTLRVVGAKHSLRIITGLLAVGILTPGQPVHATTHGVAAWLSVNTSMGQLKFLKKQQPKEDPFNQVPANDGQIVAGDKERARQLLLQARTALAQGNIESAAMLTEHAASLRVQYGPNEDSPTRMAGDIRLASQQTPINSSGSPGVIRDGNARGDAPPRYPGLQLSHEEPVPATHGGPQPAGAPGTGTRGGVQQSLYVPPLDRTYVDLVSGDDSALPTRSSQLLLSDPSNNPPPAVRPPNLPSVAAGRSGPPNNTDVDARFLSPNLLAETSQAQQRLKQMVAADVAKETRAALELREKDPLGAMEKLKSVRTMVTETALASNDKRLMTNRVDRMISEMQKYIDQHRAEIENDQRNKGVLEDLDRSRTYELEVQQRLQDLVKEFNELIDEDRYYEAEAKAREARALAPEEQVVTQMWHHIRFLHRVKNNQTLEADRDDSFVNTLDDVNRSATISVGDRNPIIFRDNWEELSLQRQKYSGDSERRRHPSELEIERKLSMPISMKFKDAPIGEVIQYIKQVAGINIHFDRLGLAEEGIDPSATLVTLDLSNEVSLKSALRIMLEELNLNYVITNEVLKITSDQLRDRTVYPKTYNVADLVIPIPQFVPHDQLGLPTQLQRGYHRTQLDLAGGGPAPGVMGIAQNNNVGTATPEGMLAQVNSGTTGATTPGGSSAADFDSLIELITKTVDPDSWDEVGGQGSIAEFETNLSLVISQTQEIHEKIADLLDQLRRLQDLQVTIEVRFITLRDDFFEQIGIDFDFNLPDNNPVLPNDDSGPTTTVGLDIQNGNVTGAIAQAGNDYLFDSVGGLPLNGYGSGDIQVRQGNFPAIPAFGGFDPSFATTFGIAILSDIEAFFVLRAAQGDDRTNVMQAPKVTLFNGQAASISDQVQQPFVISVTPVVGDFAAAQAPVIVVLAEGTTLSVQAVVSPDRRFVRLTLIPFFSEIRGVNEFTFNGSSSTSTVPVQDPNDPNGKSFQTKTVTEGTTIQLPTFAFTTVTTTVSVPDGGTVLLGGIKRLREARLERGTPFLSKLPYISRLFRNVGIGRETESLMLMVTPRIIIQEEEEEKLGISL
ncbi:MAG: hypothetical protein WBF93_10235 [Pirellulales bacterium]